MFHTKSTETSRPRYRVAESVTPIVGNWAIMEMRFESPHTQVARCVPVQSEATEQEEYLIKMPRWDTQSSAVACQIIRREAELLNGLDHPHLIPVLDANLNQGTPYFIMPNVGRVTLRDWIGHPGTVSIHDALWFTRQTAEALKYLHDHGWSHLDVKPENIVVNDLGHATLIDLAFATPSRSRSERPVPLAGTGQYLAPERRTSGWSVSPSADVYSLGQILLELLLGEEQHRYSAQNLFMSNRELVKSNTEQQSIPSERSERTHLIRSYYPNLPTDFYVMLEQMVASVPERRPSIGDLVGSFIDWEIKLWQP